MNDLMMIRKQGNLFALTFFMDFFLKKKHILREIYLVQCHMTYFMAVTIPHNFYHSESLLTPFGLHLDHQEPQEGSKYGYLKEMDSLDELFLTKMQGIVYFWIPWNYPHPLVPFRVIIDSIWTIRNLRKGPNMDI